MCNYQHLQAGKFHEALCCITFPKYTLMLTPTPPLTVRYDRKNYFTHKILLQPQQYQNIKKSETFFQANVYYLKPYLTNQEINVVMESVFNYYHYVVAVCI